MLLMKCSVEGGYSPHIRQARRSHEVRRLTLATKYRSQQPVAVINREEGQNAVDDNGTDDHGAQALQKEPPAQDTEGTQDDGDIEHQSHGTDGQPGKKVNDQRIAHSFSL